MSLWTEERAIAEEQDVPRRWVVAWSVGEWRHLRGCIALVIPLEARHSRFWSRWRRVHQAIARAFHYRRRLGKTTELQL